MGAMSRVTGLPVAKAARSKYVQYPSTAHPANSGTLQGASNAKQALDTRRFAHFSPNLLKSLDRVFSKSVSSPVQFIDFKGLTKMTEPRVIPRKKYTTERIQRWQPN